MKLFKTEDHFEFREDLTTNLFTEEWEYYFDYKVLPYVEILEFYYRMPYHVFDGKMHPCFNDVFKGQIHVVIKWLSLLEDFNLPDGFGGWLNFRSRKIRLFSTDTEEIFKANVLEELFAEAERMREKYNTDKLH